MNERGVIQKIIHFGFQVAGYELEDNYWKGDVIRTGIMEYWNDGRMKNIVTSCGLIK